MPARAGTAATIRAGLLGLLLAGGSNPPAAAQANFSQYPGFREYFAAHPPPSDPPGASERRLLARYRPRFRLPPGHPGPIDFYRDYIGHGTLRDDRGQIVRGPITRAVLNAHKREPEAEFAYGGSGSPPRPVVYGRIERAAVDFRSASEIRRVALTFLTYNVVFERSGLPAGLDGWRAGLLALVADLDDWHQLDHYTAATLILAPQERPVGLVLQQHNYSHTYLLGESISLPSDRRIRIDVALRSNELYPAHPGRTVRRAVRFADPAGMRYLLGFGPSPFAAADDVTASVREASYRLAFLPPDDAFYVFEGFLGERRWLPGRNGPPGADYNTLPALKPWPLQAFVGYWRPGNRGDWRRFESAMKSGGYPAFARAQASVFYANWQCLRRNRNGCRLR